MIRLPSLEYQHAFDLCAAHCARQRNGDHTPILIVASNPFYAREAVSRLRHVALAGEGWQPDDDFEDVTITTLDTAQGPYSAVIWAEPLADSAAATLTRLHSLLAEDGSLAIVSSGMLARFLPETHSTSQIPLRQAGVRKLLSSAAIPVRQTVGFHGLTSIAWSYGFRMMTRLNRLDLADRCLVKMRTVYAVPEGRACTLHTFITGSIGSVEQETAA
ncbi:MAG: hypothetical protein ACOCX5_01735 [Chloroflexota bacterium]